MSSSLKEVKRTAAIAWSPASQTSPLLATGTLSGALDDSFSTNAELEVYDLKLYDDAQTGSPSRSDVIQKTMISASARLVFISLRLINFQ